MLIAEKNNNPIDVRNKGTEHKPVGCSHIKNLLHFLLREREKEAEKRCKEKWWERNIPQVSYMIWDM